MAASTPALIVHGGAGRLPAQRRVAALIGCRTAAEAGWRVLEGGGSALDAVETAVAALENHPSFNAGTGAALNAEGEVQLDASIMDGARLAAGAVAHVQDVRNPISLARRVLEDGRHVLLVSDGASRFAAQLGLPRCANHALITPAQQQAWREQHGTVGCVALDRAGRLAAGTSTGGRMGALPGRVGDSPLIGCGTYASEAGGVSCTGIGEDIIRVTLAKTAVDYLAAGESAPAAAQRAMALFAGRTGSEAGLIVIDRHGRIGHAHNCQSMSLACVGPDGRCHGDA